MQTTIQLIYKSISGSKKKERFETILEPLQALIQIGFLSYYPIGTKFKPILPIVVSGQTYDGIITSEYKPRIWVSDRGCNNGIEVSKIGLIYYEGTNKWAEIIKEETNMETQKLSRKGLKEIHSVSFGYWQAILELFGTRNPFEDYVELTQKEVDEMLEEHN